MLEGRIVREIAPASDPVIARRVFGDLEGERTSGLGIVKAIDPVDATGCYCLESQESNEGGS